MQSGSLNPQDLPADHVVTSLTKFHHGSTIETAPPACRFTKIEDLLKLFIRGTVLIWMFQRLAQCMCNLATSWTSSILIGDEPRWDEGRACNIRTVDPVNGRALDTFGTKRGQFLITEKPKSDACRNDSSAAAWWVEILVSGRVEEQLLHTIVAVDVATWSRKSL